MLLSTLTLRALTVVPKIEETCFNAESLPVILNNSIAAINIINTSVDSLHMAVLIGPQGSPLNALVHDVIEKENRTRLALGPFFNCASRAGQTQVGVPPDPRVVAAEGSQTQIVQLLTEITSNDGLAVSNEASANRARCCKMLPALDEIFSNSAKILDIPTDTVIGISAPRPLVCGYISCP